MCTKNCIAISHCEGRCTLDLCAGVFGIGWCILWMVLVHDSPAQHPRITAAERQYIETSIGTKKQHQSVYYCNFPASVLALFCIIRRLLVLRLDF